MKLEFRLAKYENIEEIYSVETRCFPIENQVEKQYYEDALKTYPEHFILLYADDVLAGFINAIPTNEEILLDSMLEDVSDFAKDGKNLVIVGLMVLSDYRGKGFAAKLMNELIKMAENEKKKKIILTCLDVLVPFYKKFGYIYEGVSDSKLGGNTWYQMYLPIISE